MSWLCWQQRPSLGYLISAQKPSTDVPQCKIVTISDWYLYSQYVFCDLPALWVEYLVSVVVCYHSIWSLIHTHPAESVGEHIGGCSWLSWVFGWIVWVYSTKTCYILYVYKWPLQGLSVCGGGWACKTGRSSWVCVFNENMLHNLCENDLYKRLSVCGGDWACKTGRSRWLGFLCACCQMEWECTHILTSHYFLLPLSIYSNNSLSIPAHIVGGSPGLTAPWFRPVIALDVVDWRVDLHACAVTWESTANVYVFVMLGCMTNRLNIGSMPWCK